MMEKEMLLSYIENDDTVSMDAVLERYKYEIVELSVKKTPNDISPQEFRFRLLVFALFNMTKKNINNGFMPYLETMAERYRERLVFCRPKRLVMASAVNMCYRLSTFGVGCGKSNSFADVKKYLSDPKNILRTRSPTEYMFLVRGNEHDVNSVASIGSGMAQKNLHTCVHILSRISNLLKSKGIGVIPKTKYLPYEEAKKAISGRCFNIRTLKGWAAWLESNNPPIGVPRYPHLTYKEFKSMSDFTGAK